MDCCFCDLTKQVKTLQSLSAALLSYAQHADAKLTLILNAQGGAISDADRAAIEEATKKLQASLLNLQAAQQAGTPQA